MHLHRYWIKFRVSMSDPHAPGTLMGIGLTAYSREDAFELIRQKVYETSALPEIESVIEDVAISNLDPKHVLPNIGNHFERGIWYPGGYD